MPRCPVCRSPYKREHERCSACGWDLQSYSFVVGLMPEVAQKAQSQLAWAKDLWGMLLRDRQQVAQLQLQLKETAAAKAQIEQQLGQQLVEKSQERDALAEALQAQRSEFDNWQAAFEQLQSQQPASPVAPIPAEPIPAEPTPAEPTPAPPIQTAQPAAQQLFHFQVITLDEQGNSTCEDRSAPGFLEPLSQDQVLEMLVLPSGKFRMGSPDEEAGREASETEHWVEVASCWMGRFPITQSQWRAVANWPQIDRSLNPDPSTFKGEQLPVEQVTWQDATEFCARLSQATGRLYRLPSEAEWEYACRAETKTPFHFGQTLSADWVNYDGSYIYGSGIEGLYRQQTTPVDQFQAANAFGLAEMHGNVWEWCADLWHENYDDAPADGSIWLEGGTENHRVLRGGAWYCLPSLCRAAQRHWDQADHAGSGISFRVVCAFSE